MNRVWACITAGLALFIACGVAFSACAHDDSTIFIKQVLAPPLVTAGQACTFTSDPTQPYITHGVFDTAFASEYSATFLVGNQMVPRGDPSAPKTETSIVTIKGAVVTISSSAGTTSFTTLTAATIPPSNGNSPSYAPISVVVINFATAQTLAATLTPREIIRVVATVKFFGKTLGGQSVESNEFAFPIDVCFGCLVSFGTNCSSNATTQPVPCMVGQDSPIDCTQCQGNPACNNCPCATVPINVPVDSGTTPINVDAGSSMDAGGGG